MIDIQKVDFTHFSKLYIKPKEGFKLNIASSCTLCNLSKLKDFKLIKPRPKLLKYSKNFLLLSQPLHKAELELLSNCLLNEGLDIENFSICYATLCAPTSNVEQKRLCAGFVIELIKASGAKNVLVLGEVASSALFKNAKAISVIFANLSGKNVKFVINYEPAKLIKSPDLKADFCAFLNHLRN